MAAIVASAIGGSAALASGNSTLSGSLPAAPSAFATNASGETYGSSAGQTPATEPNLIYASGHTGAGTIVYGYVRKTDLNSASGADVSTPAQAAAYEAKAENAGPVSIPLYAVNGTTVVGSFTITPPGGAGASIARAGTQGSTAAR